MRNTIRKSKRGGQVKTSRWEVDSVTSGYESVCDQGWDAISPPFRYAIRGDPIGDLGSSSSSSSRSTDAEGQPEETRLSLCHVWPPSSEVAHAAPTSDKDLLRQHFKRLLLNHDISPDRTIIWTSFAVRSAVAVGTEQTARRQSVIVTENNTLTRVHNNIKLINAGVFGCVFRARHYIDKTECAIKVVALPPDIMDNVRREVLILARLPSHGNIIKYTGCWIERVDKVSDSCVSSVRRDCGSDRTSCLRLIICFVCEWTCATVT